VTAAPARDESPSVAEPPQVGLYRRATAVTLVLAPAFLVADNLLHPKELEAGNEAEQLAEIADAYTRWQTAHLLGFAGIVLYAAAVLGLAFLVRRRQPLLGLAGGALGIAGLLGFAAVLALDGFTWGALGRTYSLPGSDRQTAESALHVVQSSGWALPFYLLGVAWIAGMIVLAAGVVRQRAVPAWAGGLLVIAAVMAGSEPFIISNAYFIAGSVALLIAGIAVSYFLTRMSDRDFAAGGAAPQAAGG
jgi:hypothetical protein